jgi:hypothetical protein
VDAGPKVLDGRRQHPAGDAQSDDDEDQDEKAAD